MKACHTNKLFYRKYKFKAVAKIPGCSFIRYANRDDIDRLFNSDSIQEWGGTKYNLTYHYTFENEDLRTGVLIVQRLYGVIDLTFTNYTIGLTKTIQMNVKHVTKETS